MKISGVNIQLQIYTINPESLSKRNYFTYGVVGCKFWTLLTATNGVSKTEGEK